MLTPLSEGQKTFSHKISPTISSSSSTARTRTWRTCWPTRQWTARCRRAAILPPSCRHLAAMPPPHRPAPPGAPPTAHPPCGLHPPTHTLSTLCPAPPSRMRAPLPAQAMTRAERGTPKWACFAGLMGDVGGRVPLGVPKGATKPAHRPHGSLGRLWPAQHGRGVLGGHFGTRVSAAGIGREITLICRGQISRRRRLREALVGHHGPWTRSKP